MDLNSNMTKNITWRCISKNFYFLYEIIYQCNQVFSSWNFLVHNFLIWKLCFLLKWNCYSKHTCYKIWINYDMHENYFQLVDCWYVSTSTYHLLIIHIQKSWIYGYEDYILIILFHMIAFMCCFFENGFRFYA